jgi:two-component system cell cycle sensor histidine kinase/response regulator CckA
VTPQASMPGAGGNRTILLVEDEFAVRNVARRMLERHGYRVIESASASEALERWAEHQATVDILLTDIVMPGSLNGHELAARLLGEKPSLHVVTMSGYDPGEFAGRGGGTEVHLRKPFTNEDLLNAVAGR